MPKSYMLCLAEGWMWLKRQLLVTVLPIFLSSWQNSHRSKVSPQMARTIKMCFRTGWSKWIAEVPEQAVLRLTKGLQRVVLVHTFPEKRSKEVKMIFISFRSILRPSLNLILYRMVYVLLVADKFQSSPHCNGVHKQNFDPSNPILVLKNQRG